MDASRGSSGCKRAVVGTVLTYTELAMYVDIRPRKWNDRTPGRLNTDRLRTAPAPHSPVVIRLYNQRAMAETLSRFHFRGHVPSLDVLVEEGRFRSRFRDIARSRPIGDPEEGLYRQVREGTGLH